MSNLAVVVDTLTDAAAALNRAIAALRVMVDSQEEAPDLPAAHRPPISKILAAVSDYSGVPVAHMQSPRMDQRTVRARWVVMLLARGFAYRLKTIGDAVGRDFTTVISGARKAQAGTAELQADLRWLKGQLLGVPAPKPAQKATWWGEPALRRRKRPVQQARPERDKAISSELDAAIERDRQAVRAADQRRRLAINAASRDRDTPARSASRAGACA